MIQILLGAAILMVYASIVQTLAFRLRRRKGNSVNLATTRPTGFTASALGRIRAGRTRN